MTRFKLPRNSHGASWDLVKDGTTKTLFETTTRIGVKVKLKASEKVYGVRTRILLEPQLNQLYVGIILMVQSTTEFAIKVRQSESQLCITQTQQ